MTDTPAADDALAAKAARERRYDLRTPIIRQIYDVMQAIEKCGASRELTDAVTLAGALNEPVRVLLEERDAQSREIADLRARAERAATEWQQHGPLLRDLASILNKHSVENVSNTPDFISAEFCLRCLDALDAAVNAHAKWHGQTGFRNAIAQTASGKEGK